MLRRPNRLGRSSALHRVIRYGRSVHSPELVIRFLPNHGECSRFALSIAERAQKSSVKRNRMRRQLMAQLQQWAKNPHRPMDYYLTVKHTAFTIPSKQVLRTLAQLLRRT